MSFIRITAVFLTLTLALIAAAQAPATGQGRYRVTVELLPGDDPAALAQQLAATYRGRVEAAEGAGGFVTILSDASARLVANDARVQFIREVETDDAGTWYLGPYSYDGSGIHSFPTRRSSDLKSVV